ncbi:MAG TPA: transporter substrate-binding domain-containing protein [Rhodospirillales bacterium]|nr:transporter substrate-binding domain-containing protein [Rhodospirillales bacterium]
MVKTFLRGGLALLVAAVVVTGVDASEALDRARERGHVVAAAVPDALPQSGRDAAGNLVGFDIAVSQAIGKQLGLGVEFALPSWQEVLDGGWKGRWDYAAVSMTPTPEREQALSFPAVYRFSPAVLVVHEGDTAIKAPKDASGKTIGVKEDTTYQQYLDHDLVLYKGAKPFDYQIDKPVVRLFADKADAMAALSQGNGTVDAVVTSLAHAQAAVAEGLPVRVVLGFLFFEPQAVAVDKAEPAFAEEVGRAVDALRADGTLGRLSVEWFGIDLTQ